MENWKALATDPMSLAGLALAVVFVALAMLRRRDQPGWMLPLAIALACASVTGGMGFASLRAKNVHGAKARSIKATSLASVSADQGPVVPPQRRIWVLKAPGELVEYDWSTSSPKQTIELPSNLVQLDPRGVAARIRISATGHILLAPVPSGNPTNFEAWVWDGQTGAILKVAPDSNNAAAGESALEVALSRDGQHVFWAENWSQTSDKDQQQQSITTTFHIWETDLAGGEPQEIDSVTFPECECSTGACAETCPQGALWAPESGIDRFFLATHFVAGQLQSNFLASFAYRESDGRWSAGKLPAPLESVAAAAQDGSVLVEIISDSACCGWVNESDDRTLLLSGQRSTVLFDERNRYGNADYDVNFSTSAARLSPDLKLVAMKIQASANPGDQIRLAPGGKDNPSALDGVRRALVDLPAVEVLSAGAPDRRIAFIPHSGLVGWLSNKDLLIVEDHALAVFDVITQTTRKSAIPVADDRSVFLR